MTKFETWLNKVNEQRKSEWEQRYESLPYKPLTYIKGRKYIKIVDNRTVWGFVSMWEGINKGTPVKKGDLLKPAGYNAVAAHSRGNIFEGTDQWGMYGPSYLI
jgi:hypothetical protein